MRQNLKDFYIVGNGELTWMEKPPLKRMKKCRNRRLLEKEEREGKNYLLLTTF